MSLVRATVAEIKSRCTTKVINVVRIAILHLDYSGRPAAVVTSVKAHCPVHLTICYTRVLAIQPTTPGCTTTRIGWTRRWHSCTRSTHKPKPSRTDGSITKIVIRAEGDLSVRGAEGCVVLAWVWF